jgi:hypothetical protein
MPTSAKAVLMATTLLAAAGAVKLELAGDGENKVEFGPSGADILTLSHNDSEPDKLTCSGTFEAADLRIAGTDTTVADLVARVAALEAGVRTGEQSYEFKLVGYEHSWNFPCFRYQKHALGAYPYTVGDSCAWGIFYPRTDHYLFGQPATSLCDCAERCASYHCDAFTYNTADEYQTSECLQDYDTRPRQCVLFFAPTAQPNSWYFPTANGYPGQYSDRFLKCAQVLYEHADHTGSIDMYPDPPPSPPALPPSPPVLFGLSQPYTTCQYPFRDISSKSECSAAAAELGIPFTWGSNSEAPFGYCARYSDSPIRWNPSYAQEPCYAYGNYCVCTSAEEEGSGEQGSGSGEQGSGSGEQGSGEQGSGSGEQGSPEQGPILSRAPDMNCSAPSGSITSLEFPGVLRVRA